MVSKRNYFSIVIMMGVLLFLFQFSMVLKDYHNDYDTNDRYHEKISESHKAWSQQELTLTSLTKEDGDILVFVGDKENEMGRSIYRWCTYAKWNMISCETLDELPEKMECLPGILVLESEKVLEDGQMERLESLVKEGVILIFGCLEDARNIENNEELRKLLGIREVASVQTKLSGVKLFDGLLLGGESVYEAKTPEDEERQDLDLWVPWYQVGSGTKVYMVGLLEEEEEEEEIKNEDLPTLIWRHGLYGGSVFAVVGDYMKDSTAWGLLDGMLAEGSQYRIYPVVNAQNLSIVNFPAFANENNQEMMNRYSQSVLGVIRDVMWSSLVSLSEDSNKNMTCFLQPQMDYTDEIEPESGNLRFYLKQLKEQNAEAGLSLDYQKIISMSHKLDQDAQFLEEEKSKYRYGAAYMNSEQLEEGMTYTDSGLLQNVSTLTCEYTENYPLLSYCSDSVTLQMVTSDGADYTYGDDLRMKSIQTALGYSHVMLNMKSIFWPEKETDRWELVQKKFSGNLMTYWSEFSYFDSMSLSESDQRTRTFLNLDYSQSREENLLTLNTTEKGSWFILRTHGEEITEIQGGTQKPVEEDVYLICAEDTTVTIRLEEPGLFYHTGNE